MSFMNLYAFYSLLMQKICFLCSIRMNKCKNVHEKLGGIVRYL